MCINYNGNAFTEWIPAYASKKNVDAEWDADSELEKSTLGAFKIANNILYYYKRKH